MMRALLAQPVRLTSSAVALSRRDATSYRACTCSAHPAALGATPRGWHPHLWRVYSFVHLPACRWESAGSGTELGWQQAGVQQQPAGQRQPASHLQSPGLALYMRNQALGKNVDAGTCNAPPPQTARAACRAASAAKQRGHECLRRRHGVRPRWQDRHAAWGQQLQEEQRQEAESNPQRKAACR